MAKGCPSASTAIHRQESARPPGYSGRVAESCDVLLCSFCGMSQKQVKVLIGGSHAYVCDECVGRAHAVISEPGRTAGTAIATIGQVRDKAGAKQCSFCGKGRHRVAAMASAGDVRICNECLDLCDEIVSEVPPVPSR